jgi:hypothetical protein
MKTHHICFTLAGLAAASLLLTAPAYADGSSLPPPPYSISELTPVVLAAAAAAGLSLVFRYVPGARDWFASLQPVYKQWCMFGLTAIIALGIGLWNMAVNGFSQDAVVRLLFALFAALTFNQVTYQFIKR